MPHPFNSLAMSRKIIIAIVAGVGLLVLVGFFVFKKSGPDTKADSGGGIPLPDRGGNEIDPAGGTTTGGTTSGGGSPVVTGAPVELSPQPFGACVTPPASRGRYNSNSVASDYTQKVKYYWGETAFGLDKATLNNMVHAALKSFDVNVNQNSVRDMRYEIERYLVSSDRKLYYYETIGRFRCA